MQRNLHDYGQDNIDVWYERLIRFVRVGGFWLDVARSVFLTLGAVLLGAVAGGFVSVKLWPEGFWVATLSGALLLGLAGWRLAKRVFLSDRADQTSAEESGREQEALFAPHLPGVEEQFARARRREFGLTLALIPSVLFLVYLYKAEPDWPVPGFLPRDYLTWTTLVFVVAVFVLLVMNARCPACRRRVGGLMRLRRCPICGVALRN